MFAQLNSGTARSQDKVLAASLTLHALLFAWLLHAPEPQLLNPSSIAIGHNGKVLTQLYFPTRTPDDSSTSSSDHATETYRHQRLGHEKLTWKPTSTLAKLAMPSAPLNPSAAEDDSKTATLSKLGHGAPAGLPYGSLPGGPVYGDEIRPALPIATSDPVVYPWQRPESEGKVVIEITIDERGEIVRKTVLQSLGPEIDNKCLAALENWRFQPATHNGVPIPSKQDAIFPFKARG
ncbi:MAG TPA: energy transducer TonB [Candidatus Sulfotelmatobacter sp.]|jgi:TonB family protein|nr:energy transducer TonB [Candidatus Sulfotelmatobacter sp.]